MCPEKIERVIHIGDFLIGGEKILASDPSEQGVDVQGQVIFQPCVSGLWHAFVEDDTAHTYKLIAISVDADPDSANWQIELEQSVSIETCHAGLFDLSRYKFENAFYEKICDLTVRGVGDSELGKNPAVEGWCFDRGAVTGTATESDDCLCYTMTDPGGIIYGITLVFYKSYMDWKNICLSSIFNALKRAANPCV